MNKEKLYKAITIANKVHPLRISQIMFLVNWFALFGEDDKEFGFKEAEGLEDQVKAAVELLLTTEKEWQNQVLSNNSTITLASMIINKSVDTGIEFPDDFEDKMNLIKMEEV